MNKNLSVQQSKSCFTARTFLVLTFMSMMLASVSGQSTSLTRLLRDYTPPTVIMTAPASGASVSGSGVTVSVSAFDKVGVIGVQFKLDGNNLGVEVTTSPYTIPWDTTQVSNGNHSLTAVARDAAGNRSTASPVTIAVNNNTVSHPTIASFNASPSTILTGQSTALSWLISGASSISINQGIGIVTGNSVTVNPTTTTTYILTASNSSGSVTAATTLTVNSPTPTPTVTPTPSPTPTPIPVPATNCSWYAAVNGAPNNNGSQQSPWSLAYALSGAGGSISPGNTVCVKGGTYPGRYIANLTGSASQPIIIRVIPGQRAIIDGGLPVTFLSRPTGSVGSYSNALIEVADTTFLQPNSIILVGSEQMRVDSVNQANNTVNVIRGWNGSCSTTGICNDLPAGSNIKGYNNIFETSGSSYTWFWGLEITNSGHTTRLSNQDTSTPSDIDTGVGLVDGCVVGCKYINNVVHNAGNGIGSFNNQNGSEFYGNLSFLNGWENTARDSDRGTGHGMYLQNLTADAPVKKVKDNLSFFNFGFAMQAYTDEGGVHNLLFEGNAFFESGNPVSTGATFNILMGGGNAPFQGAKFIENYTYIGQRRGTDAVGWGNTPCISPLIQGNYFAAATFELSVNCTNPSVSNNTFYSSFVRQSSFAGNIYYAVRPSGIKTFVRRNEYETGRGTVIIYNWDRSASVSVDVSSLGLSIGQQYEVRDAQNFNGSPVVVGTYNGAVMSIPMTNISVAPIYGTVLKQPTHTDREFGAFIILPTSGVNNPPPAPVSLPSGALTRYSNNPLVSPGASGSIDDEKTGPRVVLKEGAASYKMWYEAVDAPNASTVGYATSTNGKSWTKQGSVLNPSASWENGTSGEVSPNTVLLDGGVYKMWYHSFGPDGKRRIGYATSPNGISWTKNPNPVLDVGVAGSLDDYMVVEPRVFKLEDGTYRMYYGGMRQSQQGIGVYRLMTATSTDGVNWVKQNQSLFGPFDSGFGIVKDGARWHMWYGLSYNGLAYASSTDGISWTTGPNNAVLSWNPNPAAADSQGVGDSVSAYKDGSEFRIMYTGGRYNSYGRSEAICLATIAVP